MLTLIFGAIIKGLLSVLPTLGTIVLGSNDNSAASPTFRDVDGSGNNFVTVLTPLVFSGSYVTGGDTLDLTPIAQAAGITGGISNLYAAVVDSIGVGSSVGASGGFYQFLKGTALNNCKVKIFPNSAGSITELSASGYPASVTGDIVILETIWRKAQ